jgi:hypothetical protein
MQTNKPKEQTMIDNDDLSVNLNNVGVMSFLDEATDGIESVYSIPLQAGRYIFELVAAAAAPIEIAVKKGSGEKEARPAISFTMKITDVIKLAPSKDAVEDPSIFVGRTITERVVQYGDMAPAEFKGTLIGMIRDMAGQVTGTWAEILEEIVGRQFQASVKLREDRNNKGVFYPQFVRGKKGDIVAV